MFFINYLSYLYNRLRYPSSVHFRFSTRISRHSSFEGYNSLGAKTDFDGKLGLCSYIAAYCDIYAEIGRFTSVGRYVSVIRGSHPISTPYVSTHPVFYSSRKQCGITFSSHDVYKELSYADQQEKFFVKIGNDCWIGAYAKLVQGITISDGAIVLAGAVVTKDVPPYAIVGGIPARILRYRFPEEQVKKLLEIRWWNQDVNWIKNHSTDFLDVDNFLRIGDNT